MVFLDEDINLSISFGDILKIEFERPFFQDPNSFFVVTFK